MTMVQILLDLAFGSAPRRSFGRYIKDYNTRIPAPCSQDPYAQYSALLKAVSNRLIIPW
jgi:hypothetical protein